jgi:hypothetical protein
VVWVSAEGNPARSGKIARALRARQRCFAPLVFYLFTFTTLPLRALGFGPKELTHAPAVYWLFGGGLVVALWLTRGFEDSPQSQALRLAIAAEAVAERQTRRRKIALYYLGSVAALGLTALMSR